MHAEPGPPSTQDDIAQALAAARAHHDAGRLREAEALYREVLQRAPGEPDTLHLLGMLAWQTGRGDAALDLLGQAIAARPDRADYRHDLGHVLQTRGRLDDALASYRQARALDPAHADAHFNAGTVLQQQGRLDEAIACYREALALDPRDVMAQNNLGATLLAQGRTAEAAAAYGAALALRADSMPAHYGLARTHEARGRLEDALTRYRKALRLSPGHAGLRNDFGNALGKLGRTAEAIEQYRAAIGLRPDLAEAHHNLGHALAASGDVPVAIESFRRALALQPAPEFAASIANCLRGPTRLDDIPDLDALLLQALRERWARPDDLARVVIRRLEADAALEPLIARAAAAWPHRPGLAELSGVDGLRALAGHALLQALLERVPVTSVALERLLTLVRHGLLAAALADAGMPDDAVAFGCTLARQCFVNEHVFACDDAEAQRVAALRERVTAALACGEGVAPLALAVLGAYAPLASLPGIEAALALSWPAPLRAVLVQQVEEPREERRLRASLAALTPIRAPVSLEVQRQYEESPYPRWTAVAYERPARSVDAWLRARFPAAPFEALGKTAATDILVAGCGTGREAVETAQRFADAHVLAIDLSATSLAYAQRKSAELGLTNVEYAQADIAELGSLHRSFDVVSSVGVLHHLADPVAGLRTLAARVRPRGYLQIGLYSEAARRHLDAAQRFVREQGYGAAPADVRASRQALLDADGGRRFAAVTQARDFYATSECRDLLFHVQEHRFTLPRVRDLLLELRLRLLGFVLEPAVLAQYGARFRADAGKTDLQCWAAFEAEHPETFLGMYVMWVQKMP